MIRLIILTLLAAPAFSNEAALDRILASGRVQTFGVTASERLRPTARLAPGDAPLLRFRYLDGKRRHRFGDLDLVMDDAGH
jgi:hypothetical protein